MRAWAPPRSGGRAHTPDGCERGTLNTPSKHAVMRAGVCTQRRRGTEVFHAEHSVPLTCKQLLPRLLLAICICCCCVFGACARAPRGALSVQSACHRAGGWGVPCSCAALLRTTTHRSARCLIFSTPQIWEESVRAAVRLSGHMTCAHMVPEPTKSLTTCTLALIDLALATPPAARLQGRSLLLGALGCLQALKCRPVRGHSHSA
jgi:hypothetical protein